MKILRITVNNIASLYGIQTVDFTKEPLRTAGLYSISGATGAGKSTLLDALCLALYDATPRLQSIGRLEDVKQGEKQNDTRSLLRRGAVEGFAEVAFVGIDQNSWTARWSVRRSHRKADGNLQQVDMTLFRGHIEPGGLGPVEVGGRKSQVLAAIEEKIGLTFEQFTRAVLLAQNDFAAFLKADDKQRAEILQALTGTELFEEISKEIYLHTSEEKKRGEKFEAKIEGNLPLAPEDRALAETHLQSSEQNLATALSKLKDIESVVEWFRIREKRVADLQKYDAHLQDAISACDAALNHRLELQWTETISREARPLRVAQLQAEINLNQSNLASVESSKGVLVLNEQIQKILVQLEQANLELGKVKSDQIALDPQLRKARDLDARLEPITLQFQKEEVTLLQAIENRKNAGQKLHELRVQQQQLIAASDELHRSRGVLEPWLPFAKEASVWFERINNAIRSMSEIIAARRVCESIRDGFVQLDLKINRERQTFAERSQSLAAEQDLLNAALKIEKEFNPEQLASERARNEYSKEVLQELREKLHDFERLNNQVKVLLNSRKDFETKQTEVAEKLLDLEQNGLPKATLAVEIAREQWELIQAAVDDHAKRLRISLQAGKECPVCGAIDHPFSNTPPDADATAVKASKKIVKQREKQLEEIQKQLFEFKVEKDNYSQQISKIALDLQQTELALQRIDFSSLDQKEVTTIQSLPYDDRLDATDNKLRDIQNALNEIALQEKASRDATKQSIACHESVEKIRKSYLIAQESLAKLEIEHAAVLQRQQQADDNLSRSEKENLHNVERMEEVWIAFPELKSKFHLNPQQVIEDFERNVASCNQIDESIRDLDSQIQGLALKIGPLEEGARHAVQQEGVCELEFNHCKSALDSLTTERTLLLGGKNASEVEAELIERREAAEKRFDELNVEKGTAERALATATANLEMCQQSLVLAQDSALQSQSQLEAWMSQFVLANSKDLTLSDLDQFLARDEKWILSQREFIKSCDDAVTNAKGARKVYEDLLDKHLASCPTKEDQSSIEVDLERATTEHSIAKAVFEEAQLVIRSDDERRQSNRLISEQLEIHGLTIAPWLKLNEFIGSADGSKFRTIAQRKTLDMLLKYANQQLRQLAIRYRLERLPESLNLIVIDCDMEDQRRSIHSLSGGESFLVSLALALGLASLTSNRIRIESLFIDEGFGSLDPETLNTAMGALMQLESQGRKVGVISHVAEMTDAIRVQVKVIKGRAGRSYIEIPGVPSSI